MKKISLSVDPFKDSALDMLPEIQNWLESRGQKIVGRNEGPDVEITFGGDGNAMRAFSACAQQGIPVLAINAGRVGFLTFGDITKWQKPLEKLLAGKYRIMEPYGLELTYKEQQHGPLVNDFYFRCTKGVTTFNIWIDNVLYYRNLLADGCIVSTSTGSTGYSVAAGGSICLPGVSNILLTPICPAVINSPPLIVPITSTIKIEAAECRAPNKIMAVKDGVVIEETEQHSCAVVRVHEIKPRIIVLNDSNFIQALEKKGLTR